MAEDVEKYLFERFQNKLKKSSKGWQHWRFERLSDLIKEILDIQLPRDRSLKQELILLNNALEESQTLSLKKAVVSPNKAINQWSSLDKISKQLEGIKTDLDKLRPDVCPMPREERAKISRAVTTGGRVDRSEVHGLEDEVDSLERLLLSPERAESDGFKAVGIVGMRGVGKTTLAQVLFHRPKVKDRFLPRIWVCVSQSPQLDPAATDWKVALTERILKQLGVDEEKSRSIYSKQGLSGLLYALHLQLAGKRYLIVLDDAWNADPWFEKLGSCFKCEDDKSDWEKRLAYALPKESGGAVIFTTRFEKVGNLMTGRDNLQFLHPFSDPEICWKIFTDEVHTNGIDEIDQMDNNPQQLEKLKAELTKKCEGLPLAARVMGQFFVEQLHEKSKPKQSHS